MIEKTTGPLAWLGRTALIGVLLIGTCVRVLADATQTLSEPSGNDLVLVAYDRAGVEPPFAEWAQTTLQVKSANEFNRAKEEQGQEKILRDRFQQMKSVGFLSLNLSTQFGEYNDAYKEFDFDLNDSAEIIKMDSFITNTYASIRLTNGGLAQAWAIDPAQAQKVLARNPNRKVILALKLQVTGASLPSSGFGPIIIETKVISYDVKGAGNNMRLGHVDVK